MIANLKKIETIIVKIVRDLNLKDNINEEDFIEWIAEAMRFIDAFEMFETKEAIIPIENYKGKFPCDYYKAVKLVLHCCINNENDFKYLMNGYWETEMYNFNLTRKLNYGLNINDQLGKYIKENQQTSTDYRIEQNTIFTSFQNGFIRFQYLAIPLDNDFLPLVPDLVSVDTALFWYVAKQLALQQKLNHPELNLQFCMLQWEKYCRQARGNINHPNPMLANKIGKAFNTFTPTQNLYFNGSI